VEAKSGTTEKTYDAKIEENAGKPEYAKKVRTVSDSAVVSRLLPAADVVVARFG